MEHFCPSGDVIDMHGNTLALRCEMAECGGELRDTADTADQYSPVKTTTGELRVVAAGRLVPYLG